MDDCLSNMFNNRKNILNKYKAYSKLKKSIANESMPQKDLLTYDLSIINDLKKENQNQSTSNINNDNITLNYEPNPNINRRILRLQLKDKNYKNKSNNDKHCGNNTLSKKYELELQNTSQEKNEKIEVEIKYPIRQGIRQNCRKNSAEYINSRNNIIKRFNYNKSKKDIINKINSNEKLKNYFAKKYGGNKFDSFLNKFWKNQLNISDLADEVYIMSDVIKNEEKCEKFQRNFLQYLQRILSIKNVSNQLFEYEKKILIFFYQINK